MVTVPAQSLLAPVLAWVMAAARVMPAVCGVFRSSPLLGTTWTPCSRQWLPACCVMVLVLSRLYSSYTVAYTLLFMRYNYFSKATPTLHLRYDRGGCHGRSTTPVRDL